MKTHLFTMLLLIIAETAGAQSVGVGTANPHASTILHADIGTSTSKGILVSGTYDAANGTVPDLGIGSRLMFYPGKSAFRAGAITSETAALFWNNDNVGLLSIALGTNNLASGFASTAVGLNAKATEYYAQAYGLNAKAYGNSSTAFTSSTASGGGSFSAGMGNRASGERSTVFGSENVSKGYATTVVGMYNDSILTADQTSVLTSTPMFIVGNGTISTRSNAMVVVKHGAVGIGTNTPSIQTLLHLDAGNGSKGFLVEGVYNVNATMPNYGAGARMMYFPGKSAFRVGGVSGTQWDQTNVGGYSVAMGYNAIADGDISVAMGEGVRASGQNAVAIGYQSEATGELTTAFGAFNKAAGEISTTMGRALVANGFSSTVIGISNDPILALPQTSITSTTPLFVVGNGDAGLRKNAMVVLKNGNVGIGTNAPANNLVINSSSPEFELQSSGVQKAFVQLSGDDLRVGCYSSNIDGHFIVRLNGADRFRVLHNGNATLGGTLTQNSDERLKENIAPIQGALNKVMQINGYEYSWKHDLQRDTASQIGLLAQNVEKVLPQLVLTDAEGIKSVAYQNMVPVLVEAIKELQQEVNRLKEQLAVDNNNQNNKNK